MFCEQRAASSIKRVLIFRLGSIGDFVVALPGLHAIRQNLPNAEIALLTNLPVDSRAAPAASVLDHAHLIDKYFFYSVGQRDITSICSIAKRVTAYSPDLLVYLAEPRGLLSVYRDYLFFRYCGISSIAGMPFGLSMQPNRPLNSKGALVKSEAQRLADCLAPWFGAIDVSNAKNWDLRLTDDEIQAAEWTLRDFLQDQYEKIPLIGISVGTKQSINDWGDTNWKVTLEGLKTLKYGLVLLGAAEDSERSEKLAQFWSMPHINLCGHLSPRVSAATLRQLDLFICHDSGPMHLAAAVGTRCVAIFSRKNLPGKWFPTGSGHKILYPSSAGDTIQTIRPAEVISAVRDALGER